MEVDIMLRRWGGNWGYDLTIKNGGFQRFPPKNMRKSWTCWEITIKIREVIQIFGELGMTWFIPPKMGMRGRVKPLGGVSRFQLVNLSGQLIGSLGSINSNLLQGVTKGRPCTSPTWTWRCHGWSCHFLEAKCWFHLSCCWWLTTIHSWVLNPLDIFQYQLLDLTYLLRRWRFL